MSLGGCYLEMKQDVFHYLIQQNKSLQEYVNKNSLKSCTLEQSWDAVRILTQNFSPNILGSSPLSNVDLGEACFLFSSSDIHIINQQLSSIDDSTLSSLFGSSNFQNADFYWDNVFKDIDSKDKLIEYVLNVKKFFSQLHNDSIVLFYIS